MTPLAAELYSLTHRGNAGDIAFYAEACRKARSVLELGTGYGRLLPALSRASQKVVGLDLDPSLLALAKSTAQTLPEARRARLTLVRGDMQRFALDERFERILVPYNALYCLLGQRAIVRCFQRVRAHLAPSGLFIADIWAADAFHARAHARGHADERGPILSFTRRGELWDVFEESRLRRRDQRLNVTYTYVSRQRARSIVVPIDQRYLRFQELIDLLGRAGLALESVHGDFHGRPLRPDSEHVVFAARAA